MVDYSTEYLLELAVQNGGPKLHMREGLHWAVNEIERLERFIHEQGQEIALTREADEAKDREIASLRAALQFALAAMTVASQVPAIVKEYDFGPVIAETQSALEQQVKEK